MHRPIAVYRVIRLFIEIGKASLILGSAYFLLILPSLALHPTPAAQQVEGLMLAVLPTVGAGWWVLRKLRAQYSLGEARAATITFVVFAPVGLVIGLFVAQIPGSYAVLMLGNPSGRVGGLVGFLCFFAAIVMVTALVSFVPTALAVWITRRIGRVHQAE